MSQLYIRLRTGFYTHRKTIRLKSILGESAFWVPPRLWAYCAENQPDGDLSDYSAEELAMLVAYTGDAEAMLEALIASGFMDKAHKIHDWQEHNGFHAFYSDRAKKAAEARWGKKEKNQKKEDTDIEREKEPSIASSIQSPQKQFIKLWEEAFKAHHKEDYVFQGAKDGVAASKLTSNGKTPEQLIELVKQVWNCSFRMSAFLQQKTVTIHGFHSNINEIRDALSRITTGTYGNSTQNNAATRVRDARNLGTIPSPQSDFAAAHKRKLERDKAQTQAGVAGQIPQNGALPSAA